MITITTTKSDNKKAFLTTEMCEKKYKKKKFAIKLNESL